jgi:hypothetical protein
VRRIFVKESTKSIKTTGKNFELATSSFNNGYAIVFSGCIYVIGFKDVERKSADAFGRNSSPLFIGSNTMKTC